ncbi:glycosyltransferase family 39 protein [Caulobacter sp. 17J65-9]|uniref:ArnT family glycosyltransferase n=1 Tax=Caulobacter sp. 17J65-9 TaxID=2709382 RepID=UPI0013C71D8C|nr:glycosyltransferase family 39 protein [Caulobacter sp. 17J65-9]NEX92466.1 phospholipid carrier-dependent glycosyltransferase [Caulobacter sp. 17J65-9]
MSSTSILRDPWRTTLAFVGVLTLLRLLVLFTTPLELSPDEAQYWLWSRELHFGYYSKPPMIAWLIALTTGIGGNDEPWVRLSSLFLHAGTALVLFQVGRTLYDARTGLWSAVLYSLMPGVMLSAGLVSTDASLLFFLSLTLWAYARLVTEAEDRARLIAALGMGAALGLAFLSKYAALYFLAGLLAHAVISREARAAWSWKTVLAALVAFAVVAAPNVVWNAHHGFATVSHTADNANWHAGDLFHPIELLEFLGGQLGVFGPVPFVVLGVGVWMLLRGREAASAPADRLLVCMALPPLIFVAIQALLSRANANWAAAAYVAGSVLTAAWLVRWNARRTLTAALGIQGLMAALLLVSAVFPATADVLGLGRSFKDVRGWDAMTREVTARAEHEQAVGGLDSVAVDNRYVFNALSYYGRDWFGRDGRPELRAWVRTATPKSHAETFAPLDAAHGRRVLAVSRSETGSPEFAADFARFGGWEAASVKLDRKRTRDFAMGVGEDYVRRPRDPVTGLPIRP